MFVPPSTGPRPNNIRFEDSTSGSSGSSGTGSGSDSSSDSDSATIRGPPIAAQVAKLKRLTKHSTPIYEDYMPASPIGSPAASDSDTASLAEAPSKRVKTKRARTSSSDNDNNDDHVDAGDRPLTNDSIRQQLARITAYLNSNAGKSKVNVGDGKEAKKESAEQPSKKVKTEAGGDAEEKEGDKKKVVKKQTKVITYSGRSNSKQPTGGLTFKERKALHTSLSQLTKITERVVGLAKNA